MLKWLISGITLMAVGAFGLSAYSDLRQQQESDRERERVAVERSTRAQTMFAELCKTSGERIAETVSDVDGVLLIRVRPTDQDDYSQFGLDDPYGMDVGGDGYIKSFLRGFNGRHGKWEPRGYSFVDAIDLADGVRYRYTASWVVIGREDASDPSIRMRLEHDPKYDLNRYEHRMTKQVARAPFPRYGVTYRDISTPEQREAWIAGSSLQILDLAAGQLIAERIGYMMDPGQGAKGGGRSPWLHAAHSACPAFPGSRASRVQFFQTARFAHKVLQPAEGR